MNIREQYEQNKDLVQLKGTSNPDLFVLKYKRKCFYEGIWNDFLRECRGLVIDKDWNIVSLPFTKIYNFGIEKEAPKFDRDELVFVSEKINGFMIAVTWYNDDLLWSTTGSIDSDFVGYAKEIFESWSEKQQFKFRQIIGDREESTFMFECCHPKDPHIVHEEPGLYFIGTREKSFDSKPELFDETFERVMWADTDVKIVPTFTIRASELTRIAKESKREGFVFTSLKNDYRCSKIKTPHYLAKKFLMRGTWQKFINSRKDIDEEFYGLVKYIREVERERFFELDEISRREYIERWFAERM